MSNKKTNKISFGEFLKEVRKENEMTQQIFGDLLGVDRAYLSQLESGKRNPSKLFVNALTWCPHLEFSENKLKRVDYES